jgi:hypothetical protein
MSRDAITSIDALGLTTIDVVGHSIGYHRHFREVARRYLPGLKARVWAPRS